MNSINLPLNYWPKTQNSHLNVNTKFTSDAKRMGNLKKLTDGLFLNICGVAAQKTAAK
jgi:hypothetical protein